MSITQIGNNESPTFIQSRVNSRLHNKPILLCRFIKIDLERKRIWFDNESERYDKYKICGIIFLSNT